jgi:hypothetical protein
MSDLYNRLEELQGMAAVLIDDVEHLRSLIGVDASISKEEELNRRFYVRAVFALVEAVVEQHKRLLLDLAERGLIPLEPGVQMLLSERVPTAKENGKVTYRNQYLNLETKLRSVYRAAGDAFTEQLKVDFSDGGWVSFQDALDVRNRVTHPKTFNDCHVDGDSLAKVNRGHEWFKGLNNEFVRMARKHRESHPW